MKKIYPKQVYDPLRKRIAYETMQKELRKLLPSAPEKLWVKLDRDVKNWFLGKQSELASVHDFWNGFEGITQGFKLKGILPYLTAENVRWSKKKIPLDKIIFTTNLPILSFLVQAPFESKILIDFIKNPKNKSKVKKIQKDSNKHAYSSVNRDHYPIIVLRDKNLFRILDGHRRAIRTILQRKQKIEAYVGTFTGKAKIPKNYWVSTGFMRNLVRISNENYSDKNFLKSIAYILKKILGKSENAKYIFPLRVSTKSKSIDKPKISVII